MSKDYDFSGWATKNDIRCSDGRVIKKDAFVAQDGMTVPLLYNHDHSDPTNVLGHALLMNKPDGVFMHGYFNDSPKAQHTKEAVQHSDLFALSIYANQLVETGAEVVHGMIREVSLVLAGANPGAVIEPVLEHSIDGEDSAYITFNGMNDFSFSDADELSHADEKPEKKEQEEAPKKEPEEAPKKEGKSALEILEALTDEQQAAVYELIKAVREADKGGEDDQDEEDDEDEEEKVVKHNVFENDARTSRSGVICHADQMDILERAKDTRVGTFKNALKSYAEENALQHDDTAAPVGGFVDNPDGHTMFVDILPEYKDVRPTTELVTDDQGWIGVVMSKTHKSPISRIRTGQVDIRKAEQLRAKGYKKGERKSYTGNIKMARRTTDPQTIYVKNALHRDDIVDITDFDYVQYLYNIDRMMLNAEVATAVMLGDGRDDSDPDKISPEHIRPIWTDDELYTMHVDINRDGIQGSNTTGYFGENYIEAEAMINTCLYAREKYKGTGTPDMFIAPHKLNVMLLARDRNGRRIYSSKAELATALNVNNIYTAEQFEDQVRSTTVDGQVVNKALVALIVNLADYSLGSTKGGEVTHFTQFDIDFNQQKSLLETRLSGALTRIYSAIAIEEPAEASASSDDSGDEGNNG